MPQTPAFSPRGHKPRVGPLVLPVGGRRGPTPSWPIEDEVTEREWNIWCELWRKPQAVAWEQIACEMTVARYCQLLAECQLGASSAVHSVTTTLEDRLGLSPKAMRLLLWQIGDDDKEATAEGDQVLDVRARFRATG